MMLNLKVTARALLLALLASAAACGGSDNDPLVRQTQYGKVEGAGDAGTYAWKGIPYAKSPSGDLRWRAPAEPAAWNATRPAKTFANACAQFGRIIGPGANNRHDETVGSTLLQSVGSEDCLALNIWRPATAETNLPVIVFFHGGSNIAGYTADPVYHGANLAKAANAVVVTPNFRLGILGFFNLAQLKTGNAEEDSGNFTLLDSIKSLEFVQRNIADFGGNPGNVSIVGHSAGAINVYALQASPKLADAPTKLFHKVVPLSGGYTTVGNLAPGNLPLVLPTATYLLQSNTLLQQLVIADGLAADAAGAQAHVASLDKAQVAQYLRAKSTSALFATLVAKLAPLGLNGSGVIPDGVIAPTDAIAAVNAGRYVKGPVLAGNTRDEGKLFPSFLPLLGHPPARLVNDFQLFTNHLNYQPDAAPQTAIEHWLAPAYLPVNTPVTGFTARSEALSRALFLNARDLQLDALRAKQTNVWFYRFDWDEEPAPWNDIYGAAHLFDMPFLFGNFGLSLFSNVAFSTANRPGRLELSAAMMQSLGAFARNGDPNHAALGVNWPAWPSTLVFDASPAVKTIRVE